MDFSLASSLAWYVAIDIDDESDSCGDMCKTACF